MTDSELKHATFAMTTTQPNESSTTAGSSSATTAVQPITSQPITDKMALRYIATIKEIDANEEARVNLVKDEISKTRAEIRTLNVERGRVINKIASLQARVLRLHRDTRLRRTRRQFIERKLQDRLAEIKGRELQKAAREAARKSNIEWRKRHNFPTAGALVKAGRTT